MPGEAPLQSYGRAHKFDRIDILCKWALYLYKLMKWALSLVVEQNGNRLLAWHGVLKDVNSKTVPPSHFLLSSAVLCRPQVECIAVMLPAR